MTDEGMTLDMEKMKQARESLKASGEKMGGKVGEALKIAAELQGSMSDIGEKCMKAGEEVGPYFDMESFSKSRDYAGGIEKFSKLISINEGALATFKAFEPELEKRLNEIGFTGEERKGFDAGFKRKWGKTSELVKIVRDADIQLGKIGIAMMEGLKKGDSQWQWDSEAEQITFQTDSQIEWYNSQMQQVGELGDKQVKAQEELIAHMKAP